MSGISGDDRRLMVEGMISLHAEIQAEISKPVLEPGRLMRLQGAALNQCLIALAALLSPDALADLREEADKT